uniref:Uncharacterized protein n=1 Tax=viral metagenome TaxID=1070528 RepID=A0A6C0K622_9ZZZZ
MKEEKKIEIPFGRRVSDPIINTLFEELFDLLFPLFFFNLPDSTTFNR